MTPRGHLIPEVTKSSDTVHVRNPAQNSLLVSSEKYIVVMAYNHQLKYINEWDAKGYLAAVYCDPLQFSYQITDFLSYFPESSLTILEYSGGPSLLKMMITLVPKASEIIFSDFLEQNRGEVMKWLDKDPGAFDWKPAIKHILKLEGSSGDAENILKRESMLQDKIKAWFIVTWLPQK